MVYACSQPDAEQLRLRLLPFFVRYAIPSTAKGNNPKTCCQPQSIEGVLWLNIYTAIQTKPQYAGEKCSISRL